MFEATVSHISGQQRKLRIDIRFFSIPFQEAMDGKGSAKFVQMGRSVADSTMIFLIMVNPEASENLTKILTGPLPVVWSGFGQE